jgi:hypothetical protein
MTMMTMMILAIVMMLYVQPLTMNLLSQTSRVPPALPPLLHFIHVLYPSLRFSRARIRCRAFGFIWARDVLLKIRDRAVGSAAAHQCARILFMFCRLGTA